MQNHGLNGPQQELTQAIASAYLSAAKSELGRLPESLQDLIDSVADHNQLMIDAMAATSGCVAALIDELMRYTSESATSAWTGVVNHLFEVVRILIELDNLEGDEE